MQKAYAQALDLLIKDGVSEADAAEKLLTHLKASGRTKLLPQLLRELKTQVKRRQKRGVILEAASPVEAKLAEEAARREGVTAQAVINPALIRGWRLATADTLIDQSGKRALIDLYRRIVR